MLLSTITTAYLFSKYHASEWVFGYDYVCMCVVVRVCMRVRMRVCGVCRRMFLDCQQLPSP